MDSLIQELEGLEKGSREYDAGIWWNIHKTPDGHIPLATTLREAITAAKTNRVNADGGIAHYTTSIDAALTLVPDGWYWTIDGAPSGYACASVFREDTKGEQHYAGGDLQDGNTPALALVIAALNARQE